MEVRVIDLDNYAQNTITSALYESGIFCVKVSNEFQQVNERFIDLLEKYADLPKEIKQRHIRKDLHYQIGLTPENTETPMDHCEKVYRMGGLKPSGKDPKQRWFHRTTPLVQTEFNDITGENIIPDEFPEWEELFNTMGDLFSGVLRRVNDVLEEELNYPFNKLCENGNHLIAPTITPLKSLIEARQKIIAGFHSDISFLSIHGKGRYPGLNIWTRDNTKVRVKVPDGCVVIQAGRQLEYITNGYIMAGFHEVVIDTDTVETFNTRTTTGLSGTRISSTFFAHIASDSLMEVLPQFQTHDYLLHHPPIKEGDWIRRELVNTLL